MTGQPVDLTPSDLALLVKLGLLEATRQTKNGRVTEYRITHAGRILAAGSQAK